jgi:hypothetical protein
MADDHDTVNGDNPPSTYLGMRGEWTYLGNRRDGHWYNFRAWSVEEAEAHDSVARLIPRMERYKAAAAAANEPDVPMVLRIYCADMSKGKQCQRELGRIVQTKFGLVLTNRKMKAHRTLSPVLGPAGITEAFPLPPEPLDYFEPSLDETVPLGFWCPKHGGGLGPTRRDLKAAVAEARSRSKKSIFVLHEQVTDP